MGAGACFEMLLISIVNQCVQAIDTSDNDISATADIAAVRAAKFDILFAPETNAPCAAVTGPNKYLGLIKKFHNSLLYSFVQKIKKGDTTISL